MSSSRRTKARPVRLAHTQDRIAVRRFPRWRSPVGEGAKRPVPTLTDEDEDEEEDEGEGEGEDEARAEAGSESWEETGAWEESGAGEDTASESGPGGKNETEK